MFFFYSPVVIALILLDDGREKEEGGHQASLSLDFMKYGDAKMELKEGGSEYCRRKNGRIILWEGEEGTGNEL